MHTQRNIKTTLAILQDEIRGDIQSALLKMHQEYSMTWMYLNKNIKFPKVSGREIKKTMNEVYKIAGRKYNIKNIISEKNIVMVEMIESYPAKDKKLYVTPLVLVLEFEDGKIIRGRHYCDPRVSKEFLSKESVLKLFK